MKWASASLFHPSSFILVLSTLLARSKQGVGRDYSRHPEYRIRSWSRCGSLRDFHDVARFQLKVLHAALADVSIVESDRLRLCRIGIHIADDGTFLLFCMEEDSTGVGNGLCQRHLAAIRDPSRPREAAVDVQEQLSG